MSAVRTVTEIIVKNCRKVSVEVPLSMQKSQLEDPPC